ncbi:pyridoxamine 5'-phosphate oxidase family protein [Haloarchaeobius sp. DFWS5]|uniref:pyridoxamine 5'-phosphate oxidase family protein n=1 Tax=Haloarchaeobius sp. DFWS5 TaxID=3446114 RepID=UPI003EBA1212
MEDMRSVRLSDEARDEFLGRGGTGVLSFASDVDQPPYTIPVSYGYDAEETTFYFRLAMGEDHGKTEFVDRDRPVSLVVSDRTDDGWRSVVASGTLNEVTEGAVGNEILDRMARIQLPLVDVFDRDPREVTFRFFRLRPTEIGARAEAKSDD